jgi:hypothetical protein
LSPGGFGRARSPGTQRLRGAPALAHAIVTLAAGFVTLASIGRVRGTGRR